MYTTYTILGLLCVNTLFINNSQENWQERDFKEYLFIQNNNRCLVNENEPCIKQFIKQPFKPNEERYYTVICGE